MGERLSWWLDPAVLFFLAVAFAWAIWGMWTVVEYDTHVKFEGKIKRGVRIWSEPLPADFEQFLRSLPRSVFSNRTERFIKKQDQAVLIQAAHLRPRWRRVGGTPYVAYIDLDAGEPRIEYRNPIAETLFHVFWIAGAVAMSFVDPVALVFVVFGLLFSVVKFVSCRERILKFVRRAMQVHQGDSS